MAFDPQGNIFFGTGGAISDLLPRRKNSRTGLQATMSLAWIRLVMFGTLTAALYTSSIPRLAR